MHCNRILFERIKGVLDRPAFSKQVMFDSKSVTARASLSPVVLARNVPGDIDSAPDSQSKAEDHAASTNLKTHDSVLLLPQTKNFIMPKRLEVSPRRMKIFHGHQIGQDNSVNADLASNKL